MPMRRINVSLSGHEFISFLVREKDHEITSDLEQLKKIGILVKSCVDKNPAPGDIYLVNFRAEMPDASSVLNITRHSIAIKRGEVISVFPNKIIAYSPVSIPFSMTPVPELPKISIQIDNVADEKEVRMSPQLFSDIVKSDAITTFVNFKPSLTPELELPRGINVDEVNRLLGTTGTENFVAKQGKAEATFTKMQLSIFPYFIPQLHKLLSATTKQIIDKILLRKREYDGVIGILKDFAHDTEINKLASSLPLTDNIWLNFQNQVITPLINNVVRKKKDIKPEADLQLLLNSMSEKLVSNANQANMDKKLILKVKDNFIRALQVTLLENWSKLNKLAASDPTKAIRVNDFKDYIKEFDAHIVVEGKTEYLSFSAQYYKKNLVEIAADINAHKNSEFREALLEQLRKSGNSHYYTISNGMIEWTKTVINANNPAALQEEDKDLQTRVDLFFTDCDLKLKDQSLKSEATLIADQVDTVKLELIIIKEQWSTLNTTIQKLKVEIKETAAHINAQAREVAEQQKSLVQLNIDMQEKAPNLAMLELQTTLGTVNGSLAVVQNHLNDIGSARNSEDALRVSKIAETELVTLNAAKANLQLGQNTVVQAMIQADIRIHNTRLDLLLRHNFSMIKTVVYDDSYWNDNTTKFLCIGGTSVMKDGRAVRMPRGMAEMYAEFAALETHQNLTTQQIIETLARILKIAMAALNRANKITTFYSRKSPTQRTYEEIVKQLNLNIAELLASKDIPLPIDFNSINPQWAVSLAEDRYGHELSTTVVVNSENSFTEYSDNNRDLSSRYSISASA
jgi:tRNA U38,U39,U40 pseudouridine synthase TruA